MGSEGVGCLPVGSVVVKGEKSVGVCVSEGGWLLR